MKWSTEQQAIINAVFEGKNVAVNAVAGSGKTTVVLGIAKKCADYNIIQLTYNRFLKEEVCAKIRKTSLKNIHVFTYHGMATKYYGECRNDYQMEKIIDDGKTPATEPVQIDDSLEVEPMTINIDEFLDANLESDSELEDDVKETKYTIPSNTILIIDEVQDMKELYYRFVLKILAKFNIRRLVLLGDERQCLYKHNDGDARYLTQASEIFPRFDIEQMYLTISFRITKQIADFINRMCCTEGIIDSEKDGVPVQYIRYGKWDAGMKFVANELINLMAKNKYRPDDVFILVNSVKQNNKLKPFQILANHLSELKVPIFCNNNDDCQLSIDEIVGKVVFTTFNQAKGRERKVCVLMDFCHSHFEYYEKNVAPDVLSDKLYVGITRASEILYLLVNKEPMRFLKLAENRFDECKSVCYRSVDKVDKNMWDIEFDEFVPAVHATTPSDLVKHLGQSCQTNCTRLLEKIVSTVEQGAELIITENKIVQDDLIENVSDITGLFIPSMYEYATTGKSSIFDCLVNNKILQRSVEIIIRQTKISSLMEYIENLRKKISRTGVMENSSLSIDYKIANEKIVITISGISSYYEWEDYIREYLRDANIPCKFGYYLTYGNKYYNKYVEEWPENTKISKDNIEFGLCMTNIYKSIQTGMIHNLNQIRRFNWLGKEELEKIKCKCSILGKFVTYEEPIEFVKQCGKYEVRIYGRIDAMNTDTLWELKVVTELQLEHYLQLIIYMHMLEESGESKKYYKLCNINSGEIMAFRYDKAVVGAIVKLLIDNKYNEKAEIPTEKFIENCLRWNNNVPGKIEESSVVVDDRHTIIYDLETSGGKEQKIVQIAYVVLDLGGDIIKKKSIYINHLDGTVDYYGKLHEQIRSKGISEWIAIDLIYDDFSSVKNIVGYNNLGFDDRRLFPLFIKYGKQAIKGKSIDLMSIARSICQSKDKNGKIKNPKLLEFYSFCTGNMVNDDLLHTAEYDVNVTYECFKYLKKHNLIDT